MAASEMRLLGLPITVAAAVLALSACSRGSGTTVLTLDTRGCPATLAGATELDVTIMTADGKQAMAAYPVSGGSIAGTLGARLPSGLKGPLTITVSARGASMSV